MSVVEKESEMKSENEFSTIKETLEKENELEKEMSEKDEREEEKERNVFTNQHVSFPCVVSSFQVSRDSIDKFQLQYLPEEERFHLIEKGDTLEWFPPKEGGYENNLLSFQTICDSHVFKNNIVRFINKGVHDLERFFANKWPDLRTNRLQEGGYDAILIASYFETI
ncbi:hypothetical protein J1N35_000704 [Gossypium stocksii]|uniref:Uncharacterized protein n=1 Tax=Gossypium stocksii TaxID=47602 RepID=A0A9D3WHY8_9ROSI|nr:hypothetical protein J1N35_000704 [Gossypium stocksii]